jgi:hypothetical protein
MKISPIGAELFHANRLADGSKKRQTDMTKLIIAFSNFSYVSDTGLLASLCKIPSSYRAVNTFIFYFFHLLHAPSQP